MQQHSPLSGSFCYHKSMNKRVRNFKALDHPIHHTFLSYFNLIILVAILLFSFSLWKAQADLKRIADNMRFRMSAPAERGVMILYRVKEGDELSGLAEEFEISEQTIKWANEELVEGELQKDMIIRIPPVDGTIHEVQIGETTQSIATLYQVSPDVIKEYPYNTFTDIDKNLPTIGQTVIIPGGKKSTENVLGEFIRRIFYRE